MAIAPERTSREGAIAGGNAMGTQLLTDKIVLITGGTGGIGRPTAAALARLGATVILVGRDPRRAERARRLVSEASGSTRVAGLLADLSSLESAHGPAARFAEHPPRLRPLFNAT